MGDDQPCDRARGCKDHALHEKQPGELPTGRAEGDADAEFVPARGRSRQEQVRNVRARNQEHEPSNAKQRHERSLVLAA